MAPKAPASGTDDVDCNFTPKEMTVLALAWQCLEGDAKVDTKKLAKLAGYTEGSASVTWGKIRRKLKAVADSQEKKDGDDDGNTAADGVPATPKTPASRKRKNKKADAEGEGGEGGTPTKKPRTPRKKAVEVKPEPKQEDNSGGEADNEDMDVAKDEADVLAMKSEDMA